MSQNMLGSPREDLFGITHDFVSKLQNGTITPLQAKRFLRKENPFDGSVANIDWPATYHELGVAGPGAIINRDDDFWYVPVMEGVTCNLVIATLRRLGITCDLYANDLDKDVTVNDRHPQSGVYTIKVARRVEADEEFNNLSANQLKEQNHSGITLLEYLLLFLGYYVTTKEYLDMENWTLCSGSRDSDGSVPRAHWCPRSRKFCVDWTHRGYRRVDLRSREAVPM